MNSPLVITLISGVMLAGAGKLYTDHEDAARDRLARRTVLIKLLSEFEQRVTSLRFADQQLNEYLGPSPGIKSEINLKNNKVSSDNFKSKSSKIGKVELNIIRGTGDYIPTAPEFKNLDILIISSEMEDAAGIVDDKLNSIRYLGVFQADPTVIWLMVRAYLPMLGRMTAGHHLLVSGGELPLLREQDLTSRQKRMIGISEVHPGDLERLQKQNDEVAARLRRDLETAESQASRQ